MNIIGIFDEFLSRQAQPDDKQFWNSMIFDVIVVGPMPDQFDLGGLLWHRYCVLQRHRNFFLRVLNFVFAMLRLEIAPDNAATDGFSLE